MRDSLWFIGSRKSHKVGNQPDGLCTHATNKLLTTKSCSVCFFFCLPPLNDYYMFRGSFYMNFYFYDIYIPNEWELRMKCFSLLYIFYLFVFICFCSKRRSICQVFKRTVYLITGENRSCVFLVFLLIFIFISFLFHS